ncbi:MAG TPA: SMI1/KNR4 family protein [Geomobilimonas sp.]|nr:SMI1/KNR4 family protein [Geomobilimonas sp.]
MISHDVIPEKEQPMPFPLDEKELQKTEQEIGAVLPESYRNAMMKCNGGTVEVWDDTWELFPIFDQTSRKHISRTCNHILKETKSAQEWATYHENAYAIAGNGSGDLLVIFRGGRIFEPQIFVWSHEDGALIAVAQDFAEMRRV